MERKFDSIVVGGSISGLLCAREISKSGLSVAVLEEDYEIGTPEHCGGLVSLDGLKKLGIIPSSKAILNEVNKAKIVSSTKGFEVSTNRGEIIVLDRRELDKQVAFQAQKLGSEIRTKSLVVSVNYDKSKEEFVIKTKDNVYYSQFFIDARGIMPAVGAAGAPWGRVPRGAAERAGHPDPQGSGATRPGDHQLDGRADRDDPAEHRPVRRRCATSEASRPVPGCRARTTARTSAAWPRPARQHDAVVDDEAERRHGRQGEQGGGEPEQAGMPAAVPPVLPFEGADPCFAAGAPLDDSAGATCSTAFRSTPR